MRLPEQLGRPPWGVVASAVIPALIAYVKVVAVKTLVVGYRSSEA